MDHICRMDEFEGSQDLVSEVGNMLICQLLPRPDHSIQISLHEIRDQIDVSEKLTKRMVFAGKAYSCFGT